MGKVTGKDLESLIENALSERITNRLVDPNAELYDTTDPPPKDKDDVESNQRNWNQLGVANTNVRKGDVIRPYEKLANKETPENELSWADVEKTIERMIAGERFSKDDKQRHQTLKWMSKNPELKSGIEAIIKKVVLGTAEEGDPNAAGKINALADKITSQIKALPDQRISTFAPQEMPPRSLETSEAEFRQGNMPKASPYLVDLFSGIDGDSIQTKLLNISEFSQAAENNALGEWAAGRDEFAPFVYAKVLTYLANEIKKTGASEAGFQFERWLALLLNLPVAGAENGAADNLGSIASGIVYTSSKLYSTIQGDLSPTQAKDKLLKTTSGGTNKIYYFIGHKIKGGSEGGKEGKIQGFHFIDAIDLYIVEISENAGVLEGRFVLNNATSKSKSWELIPKTENQMMLTPQDQRLGNLSDYKMSTIYLPQGEVTDNQLETTAELLASQVGNIENQPATKAILDAATSIKRIEANTDSYVGKSKQKKGSATDYINKITTDYLALEDLYKQIFAYGEGSDQAEISENKITKEHILKLIEESFKK